MLESTKTIFSQIIKENKDKPNILTVLKESVFELSYKKLKKLKDDDIQKMLDNLFVAYADCLKEQDFKSSQAISSLIEGLIKAVSYESEQNLYKDVYEKEKIERSVHYQKLEIKKLMRQSYKTIECAIEEFDVDEKKLILIGLQDAKLSSIEMLGVLKDAVEEAFLTTIEKGSDVENTVKEISKNFTYRAINEGKLSKHRFLEIASSIIEVASDIADTDLSYGKDVLSGAVNGTKDGILKAVEKFKSDIKYAPEEVEELLGESLEKSKKELGKMEEYFVMMIKDCQLHSSGMSAKILGEIVAQNDKSLAKLKRISNEVSEVLGERIENLKEEAIVWEREFSKMATKQFKAFTKETSNKASEVFKNIDMTKAKQATEDAKKLGVRSWEVAMGMFEGAIKSGKEILKKDDKNKKK